ncbi:MAG: dephospho-CoA kinase [Clostridia bacterium]|nr:dephospho-CoA kinase [Clostridia bacterium]
MKIIGLTGPSGSGKGYVSEIFSSYGIRSIDTDKTVHALYESDKECRNELLAEFGESIFDAQGNICRKALAQIVFSDREKLLRLNSIVHKYVRKKCDEEIEKSRINGEKALIIDAPQLFEAKMEDVCDFTVAVTADTAVRIKRLSERDMLSDADIEKRIKNQHTDEFFREKADYTVINNGDDDLILQIEKILEAEEIL